MTSTDPTITSEPVKAAGNYQFWLVAYWLIIGGAFLLTWVLTGRPGPSDVEGLKAFGTVFVPAGACLSAYFVAWLTLRNLKVQTVTSLFIEHLKPVIAQRVPAHGELFAAVSAYYRALAPLENGAISFDDVEVAENRMKDAEKYLIYVSGRCEAAWMEAWQTYRATKELVNRCHRDRASQIMLWRERVKELGEKYDKVKTIAQHEILPMR